MKAIQATMTGQGQVTVPAEVRRHLGLTARDKVNFVIGEDGVRFVPARFTLESAFGTIPARPGTSEDFESEIEEATTEAMAGKHGRPDAS